jgi:hypothetical protein
MTSIKIFNIHQTMKTTLQSVSIALDVIYTNACKSSDQQLPKHRLQKESGIGIPTFNKLWQELVNRQLLFITGSTRGQRVSWNSQKCGMNPVLVKSIYSSFNKEEKPVRRKSKFQYDEIVHYLQSRGWSGTLTRVKENGIIKVVEELNV